MDFGARAGNGGVQERGAIASGFDADIGMSVCG